MYVCDCIMNTYIHVHTKSLRYVTFPSHIQDIFIFHHSVGCLQKNSMYQLWLEAHSSLPFLVLAGAMRVASDCPYMYILLSQSCSDFTSSLSLSVLMQQKTYSCQSDALAPTFVTDIFHNSYTNMQVHIIINFKCRLF